MFVTGFEPVAFVRLQGYLGHPDEGVDGDTGLDRRFRERLARHRGDLYLLFPDWAAREREIAAAVLPRYGLEANFGACGLVTANLAEVGIHFAQVAPSYSSIAAGGTTTYGG